MKKYSIKKAVLLRRARWGCGCKGISGCCRILTLSVGCERGRAALGTLWREDCGIASNFGLPFLAAAPARRPDSARAAAGGLGRELTAGNLDFMRSVLPRAQRDAEKNEHSLDGEGKPSEWFAGGTVGCFGDAYTGWGCLECGGLYFLCVVIESFSPIVGTIP